MAVKGPQDPLEFPALEALPDRQARPVWSVYQAPMEAMGSPAPMERWEHKARQELVLMECQVCHRNWHMYVQCA